MDEKPRVLLNPDQFLELLRTYDSTPIPHEIQNSNILVTGDVILPRGAQALPGHLTFNGNLDARESLLQTFSSDVIGSANFAGSKKLFLMLGQVHGDLDMSGTAIESFDAPIPGDLILSNCEWLEHIGPKTRVEGNLAATDCKLLSRFDGIVKGNADFTGCSELRQVGEFAMVGGEVHLGDTRILRSQFKKPLVTAAISADAKPPLAIRLPPRKTFRDAFHIAGVELPPLPREDGVSRER